MNIHSFPKLLPGLALLPLLALGTGCARHSGASPAATAGVPLFETRLEINTGTGAHADYHVADLNGDNILDMAVVSLTGELKILIGNGTTYDDGQLLQIDGAPIWMDGADFDGDLDRDLVVMRAGNQTADVYLNDGSGTFTAFTSLVVGSDALAVVAADIDNDGDNDIVATRQTAPEIVTFLNGGTGLFAIGPAPALPGGGVAFNLAIGDVSRDSLPDLVVTDTANSRVVVYVMSVGQVQGTYEFDIPGRPRAAAIGDVTGDGFNDIALSAANTGQIVVVTGIDYGSANGGVVPVTRTAVQLTAPPTLCTIGDVTGDGLQDVIACQESNASIVVIPQQPGGVLNEFEQLDATGLPLRPFVGDVDQNGVNDLMALSGLGDRVNLWLGAPDGRVLGARSYDAGITRASFLGAADVDGDGDIEVAVGGYTDTQISILERNAKGALVPALMVDVGAAVLQIKTVDLDRDGRLDVLASVATGVKVLRNDSTPGNYAFTVLPGLVVAIPASNLPFGVTSADFNNDDQLDIAVCNYSGGAVHIVDGLGAPFAFGNERTVAMGGQPTDLVAADFTGDGVVDLAVSRTDMADITVLSNDGAGDFAQALSVPVGQSPNYLITGDFNRDSVADLVVSNGADGTVSILYGSAAGFDGVSFPAGQTPTALLADDLSGDGITDVLVTSLQSGDFRVLVGDGNGGFPLVSRFPGTLGASDADLQDMDGDGRRDLLIASLVTNRVSLVRNIFQDVALLATTPQQ